MQLYLYPIHMAHLENDQNGTLEPLHEIYIFLRQTPAFGTLWNSLIGTISNLLFILCL